MSHEGTYCVAIDLNQISYSWLAPISERTRNQTEQSGNNTTHYAAQCVHVLGPSKSIKFYKSLQRMVFI